MTNTSYITPFSQQQEITLDDLVELRVDVMRESLTNIGRFDEERARNRLLNNFANRDCYLIFKNRVFAGFFIFFVDGEFIKLNHLYIKQAFQGSGLGAYCFNYVKEQAVESSKKILLYALKGSRSNIFYKNQGCILTAEEEFDNVYNWLPDN